MPHLTEAISAEPVLALVVVAALAVSSGLFLGSLVRHSRAPRIEVYAAEVERLEAQSREQARLIARLRADQRGMSGLTRLLPSIVRELNRSDLDPRDIPRLIFDLVEAAFEPQQITLYLVRSPGERSERALELYLEHQKGVPDNLTLPQRIRLGEGRIGWVAEHKVEMATDDWVDFVRTEGRMIGPNHPAFRLDLVGPIIHHEEGGDQLYGVLTIGAPALRPRDEKLMVQMITNVAAIAMVNARNYRWLREQANHDGLTHLFNKRFFLKERLGAMIHDAEREARRLGVFLFDIDHFKHYNDTNGHVAGDEILRALAQVLRRNLRPTDAACRYGGEEFIVVLPEGRPGEALQAAERIRAAIEGHPFALRDSQPGGTITISGGVAVFPVHGTGSMELIQRADEALYRAKRTGRNRVLPYRGVEIGDSDGDTIGSGVDPGSDAVPTNRAEFS